MTYRMVDLIQKKRDGHALRPDEINWLIAGYTAGTIPDYQVSAFAMAVYFQGMTEEEVVSLTTAMTHSGKQLDLTSIPGVKVDKHSTGGVGDKVTLILAPLVASFGVPVAKMSGRGLGHTGGTLDKLESIKGFNIHLTEAAFVEQVKTIGLSVIGQSDDMVKADKLLYALRDVTATVDIMPLIASSIMSKKIAAGADAILLDVTVGDGAFMQNLDDAKQLAKVMVDLGNRVGRKTIAVITDMSKPLGLTIGNKLEVVEAIQVMKGQGQEELTDLVVNMGHLLLQLAGQEIDKTAIRKQLTDGTALKYFEDFVAAQGGDLADSYQIVPTEHITGFKAPRAGYIQAMPAKALGIISMKAGAGRAVKTDSLDYNAGIILQKVVGDYVEAGELILSIHHNQDIDADIHEQLAALIQISDQEVVKQDAIFDIIQ